MPPAATDAFSTPAGTTIRGLTRLWRPRGPAGDNGPLVDRVLAARGFTEPGAIREFLSPSLLGLHDPSTIPNLDNAAARILHAARSGERIVIYGDYDVDGATATAILFHTLAAIAPDARVSTYIPHRLDEGYGLNADAIRTLAAEGASLIVTVDCGITATAEAAVARDLGLDLIITDHHNPPCDPSQVPGAFAVVHPRLPGSTYPFGELCGAGVAYKLAWRLCTLACGTEKVSTDLRRLLIELLALAALGSIADVVPLIGENRVIARHGLGRLRSSPIEGLRALIEASRLDSESVSSEDVGFRLAPRLNACGRMGHARDTVELLTTAKGARAREIAEQLSQQNDQRRAVERKILEEACALAEEQGMTGPDRRAIVLAHEGWHPGVVGIVCSRLVERYARPAILMQRDGDLCSGSGRSLEGFNLHAALEACREHLAGFGGHDMAAGVRVATDRLDAFTQAFLAHTGSLLSADDLVRPLDYDATAHIADLTPDAIAQLAELEPFGAGNPPVRIRLTGCTQHSAPLAFGKLGNHLSIHACEGSATLRVIAWNWAERMPDLAGRRNLDLVVEPKISEFRGNIRVEPVLVDCRPFD